MDPKMMKVGAVYMIAGGHVLRYGGLYGGVRTIVLVEELES